MIQSVHARLLVADYGACFRFYAQVLGLTATFGNEESGYADFRAGEAGFALFDAREMAAAVGAGKAAVEPSSRERVSLVFAVANVDAACEELQARGAPLAAPPTDHAEWGIRTAHFRDPDGNLVEINQALAHS